MTQPDISPSQQGGLGNVTPGSPRWYLTRLTQRLLMRQIRYDKLERYALGDHPLPNGDRRYVAALQDLQRKCRTNYCELVIHAVTQRMKVTGFQFGPDQQNDTDAKAIWNYNDMDFQSPMILKMAATMGDAYILVAPPIEPDGEPCMTAEDPRMCITEVDPRLPTKTLAGLKLWQDDVDRTIYAALYLPDAIYLYQGPAVVDVLATDAATLTHLLVGRSGIAAGGFVQVDVQPNPVGEVTLVRGNWQPAFGTMGRAEHEPILYIQDRINHTVLDRLIIAKNQAYNQRWVTGATKGDKFKGGSDLVWATIDQDAKFGEFTAVDLTQMLAAIRDDVGDLAAISQTPATYLMNRMVNVSGDTLTQDQSALVTKTHLREEAMGWMYERAMRLAFKIKGDTAKYKETEVVTLWKDPEIRKLADVADAFSKFIAGGLPLDIAMQNTQLFTDDQIENAQQQAAELQQQQLDQQMMVNQQQTEGQMAIEKTKAGFPPKKTTSAPSKPGQPATPKKGTPGGGSGRPTSAPTKSAPAKPGKPTPSK